MWSLFLLSPTSSLPKLEKAIFQTSSELCDIDANSTKRARLLFDEGEGESGLPIFYTGLIDVFFTALTFGSYNRNFPPPPLAALAIQRDPPPPPPQPPHLATDGVPPPTLFGMGCDASWVH